VVGGAELGGMRGDKPEENKGRAQFLRSLASTENQAWWAGVTGYLPISNAAVKALESSGHYQKNPNQLTAIKQMASGKTTPNSQGIRLGNFVSIRDAIEEQIENIVGQKKTAKQGWDAAVPRGTETLKGFAALYG